METVMEAQEVDTRPVIEDFEIGERVYFLNYKHNIIEYGKITGIYTSHMDITLDSGRMPLVHVDQFAAGGPVGKCFPMEHLEVGSVISVFHSGERIYADILEIVKDSSVRFEYRSGPAREVTITASKTEPLEFQMACYTLEG